MDKRKLIEKLHKLEDEYAQKYKDVRHDDYLRGENLGFRDGLLTAIDVIEEEKYEIII